MLRDVTKVTAELSSRTLCPSVRHIRPTLSGGDGGERAIPNFDILRGRLAPVIVEALRVLLGSALPGVRSLGFKQWEIVPETRSHCTVSTM